MSGRPPYPETRQPFTWPEPGQRTWEPTPGFLFPPCTGPGCIVGRGCSVGRVKTLDGGSYGCSCDCHAVSASRP